jgi:glutamyl-tRNA synthetase
MYCHLYAKATGGSYVLRIEDTDQQRSKKEYEEAMIDDLKWLGLTHQEGPDVGGDFGPYRQSERMDIYNELIDQLVKEGKAYPCFLTQEELEQLTEKATSEKIAPHAYHGKYRDLDANEAAEKIKAGTEYVIRFKNPQKTYTFNDIVRGEVSFGPDMVGDFVIKRSNGMPVYNFCCVVDDWKMQMTHVIRAEEHLPNTLRQLMLYEAFGAKAPEFAHCSLLVGSDRQKLSKRHGATSVRQYRDQHYLPQALNNYLCLLGWSHPEEKDIFSLDEISDIFDLNRFNKAPALYDIEKLNHFNGEHLRALSEDELLAYLPCELACDHDFFKQSKEWQQTCVNFYREKIQLPSEFENFLKDIFSLEAVETEEVKEVSSWETTSQIAEYLKAEIAKIDADFVTGDDFTNWQNHLKKEMKIKGKPLFKGIRFALTSRTEGPDLKVLVPLTPVSIIKERLGKL